MSYKSKVVIIGGGIIGCSISYYLAKKGIKSLVIEKKGVCEGTSSACDGFVFLQTKKSGLPLKMAMESANIYQNLSKELGYEVYYHRPGGLILIETPQLLEVMEDIVKKQILDGMQVEIINGSEARRMEPYLSNNLIGAAYSDLDGAVNPLYSTLAYAKKSVELGAEIWTYTEVIDIKVNDGKISSVITTKGEIETDCVVVAAGAWSPEIGKMINLDIPMKPRRGQTLVTEATSPMFNKVMLCARYIAIKHNPKLAENSEDESLKLGVGLSIEQTENGNILIGNNREFAGFDISTSYEVTKEIAKYVTKFIPALKDINIIRTFAGLRPYCQDGSPILGPVSSIEGLYMATGHEGDGIALAPITGEIISDLVKGDKAQFDITPFLFDRFMNK